MNALTLSLSDPQAQLENTGGKGMSLARLINAGLPVPGGFHVTTQAYRRFVEENALQIQIMEALAAANLTTPAGAEAASQRIQQLFAAGRIPDDVAQPISEAYAHLNEAPVAVRSSATAEDLPEASFAGQQETYLNIRGREAVLEAIQKCWASLWTARAIAYRAQNNISQGQVSLAVVVQELVFAEAAGILFTANPTNGNREEALINAAWGLGEAVVSGQVTPDTLVVDKKSGRSKQREIAEKLVMTVRTPAGTQEQPVPESLQRRPVLSRMQAKELVGLGSQIEQVYGRPMDIEWALSQGKFWILQARPITALPEPPVEWIRPDPKAVYARGSLAEHTPAPVTPLFATLGLALANQATAQLYYRMLGERSASLLPAGGLYQPLNGYVFGGVRMGASSMGPILKMTLSQIGPMFRGSVERWQAARQEFSEVVDRWNDRKAATMSPSELLAGVRAVFGAASKYFTDIQTTLPAASSSEILFTRFYDRLVRRKGDPEATTFLLGFETASLQAEKSLFDLAAWIRESPNLEVYFRSTPGAELVSRLRAEPGSEDIPPQWDELQGRFLNHLEKFGRTAYEFDFANPTPAETPEPMVEAIKGFLEGRAVNPYERQEEAVQRREQASQSVLKRLGWPRKGLFAKLLRWSQKTAPMREDSIFDMGMGHPLIREMLNELGRRFAQAGAIEAAEDIYWLEEDEVEELAAALEAGQPLRSLAGRIPERKEDWQAALKLTPPVMLPERSGWRRFIHGGEAERRDGKLVLKGVGTSSGVVTAPARVLFTPEDFNRMQTGDVLVAVTTTPAWTPLFALASAVVTDIGGPLSHSSIVAREYGIPAVMATRSATRQIQDGQRVTVDGGAGTVTLEE